MCTVTYIPAKDAAFITSNRDEQQGRPPALPPEVYEGKTGRLLYPKDTAAGGTWFAVHENKSVLVLLNGAGQKHTPHPPYRKSRGLILLELADSEQILTDFKKLNLSNIEPFTLILLEEGSLYKCHWDGLNGTSRPLDASLPHIWSSVTLYDPPAIQKRKRWFEEWLLGYPNPDPENVMQFHHCSGDGDPHNDVLMNRDNQVLTVSITSLQLTAGLAHMSYHDIGGDKVFKKQLSLTHRIPAAS
ncbi:MAG TPA: NRDE family protein [Puia sp.]|nr:NRDE family protein [Puia sp.]